jgi:hypothetical protein
MENMNAERIAKIMAHVDVPDEGEATNAWRLLRREAARAGLRIVDLLFRSDVIMALDKQLEPQRRGEAELIAKIRELSDLVTKHQHNVRELSDVLAKHQHDFETARNRALREQLEFRRYHQMDIDKLQSELTACRVALRKKGNI